MAQYTPEEVLAKMREILGNKNRRFVERPIYDRPYSTVDLAPQRPCPVCKTPVGQDDFKARKHLYAYYECPNCQTLFINRHPSNPTEIYSDPLYAMAYEDKEVWEGCYQISKFMEEKASDASGYRGQAVLDIGCNHGRTSKAFREKGWKVYGLDCNPKIMEIAKGEGIELPILGDIAKLTPVHPKELPDSPIRALPEGTVAARTNTFHAIILSHIIEHVEEPVELIKKCILLLVPRGVLWIATPRYDYARIGKPSEWMHINNISTGEHTVLFTEKALKSTCENLGLTLRFYTDQDRMQSMAAMYQKGSPTPLDPAEAKWA